MLDLLNRYAEEVVGAVILAIMSAVTFINVVVRYGTNFSFAWSEEVTINLFVWAVLLGTAAVFREGGHLGMNLLYNSLRPRGKLCCDVLSFGLCLVFFLTLAYFGMLEVLDEADIEATSESLGVPVWLYTAATPLLSVLCIFRAAQHYLGRKPALQL